MNTPTMIASLIFAVVLVVLIGLVIRLMMRGWRHRGQLQEALIGTLPSVPDTVGPPTVAPTRGLYLGCTLAPKWNDRVVVGDLGYRTKAVLTRYPEGIMVQRSGARPIWIPQDSVVAVRTERGIAGRTIPPLPGRPHDGVLAIRWALPSGTEMDTGFRADDRAEHSRWLVGGEDAAPSEANERPELEDDQ
ncbi:transporter [Mycolicibacter terrae]|uniref:Transporter n=1 Tax=Mycolicibacter terrae TaxID=1788 RepID=A0AAD1I224_9MYCO|nr:transporter [Mycolicibacter terrae]ORW96903.1 transporter [Mycolicibacter terrae]BBX22411.1 transporter [Mycolicibacter terrae]SNV75670.1 putative export or membrane protein [Mycolicibacter terrae]